MSVAVSADIKPSRLLLVFMAIIAIGIACIGVTLGLSLVGKWPLIFSISLAVVCILAASFGFWCVLRNHKTVWLHISDAGQIRLVEYQALHHVRFGPQVAKAGVAQLLSGSTIFPNLLLLRLRLENGQVRIILILPDSVPEEIFRALKVACQWVASHNHSASEKMIR